MRIVIAAEIYPPTLGGPATHLTALIPALCARGHTVHVVTFGDAATTAIANETITVVPMSHGLLLRYVTYVRALLHSHIHAQVWYAQGSVISGFAVYLCSRLYSIPYVVRVPGDYIWERVRRTNASATIESVYQARWSVGVELLKKIQRIVLARAHRVFVTSQMQKRYCALWRIDNNIEVVYSGVAVTKMNAVTPRTVDPTLRYLIAPGRLINVKGFVRLVKDIAPWLLEHKQDRLVIIGEGPDRAAIERVIEQCEVVDQVIMTGAISQQEVLTWLAAAQLCIFYADYDALPHTVFEAIASGIVTIAPAVGGFIEILQNYPRGMLLQNFGSSYLKDALEQYPSYAHVPLGDCLDRYSQERMIETVEQMLLSAKL